MQVFEDEWVVLLSEGGDFLTEQESQVYLGLGMNLKTNERS